MGTSTANVSPNVKHKWVWGLCSSKELEGLTALQKTWKFSEYMKLAENPK